MSAFNVCGCLLPLLVVLSQTPPPPPPGGGLNIVCLDTCSSVHVCVYMSSININVIPSVALGGSQVSQMPRLAFLHLERHVRVAVIALALRCVGP